MQLNFRYLTNYTFLAENEPDFTPSDAISLGLLATSSQSWFRDVWLTAYRAVCEGLDLRDSDQALKWFEKDSVDFGISGGLRRASLHQLVRLRRRMTAYCDEWGDVLEGDIWGRRHGPHELRDRLSAAEAWYRTSQSQLLHGLSTFDPAICGHLGWPVERTISFLELRQRHGFPDTSYDP